MRFGGRGGQKVGGRVRGGVKQTTGEWGFHYHDLLQAHPTLARATLSLWMRAVLGANEQSTEDN